MSLSDKLLSLLKTPPPPDTEANRLWFSQYAIATCLEARKIGLFDNLELERPTSLSELAQSLSVDHEALARVCAVLHCRGLVHFEPRRALVTLTEQARAYWRTDSLLYRGAQLIEYYPDGSEAPPSYHRFRVGRMLSEGGDPARTDTATFTEMWESGEVEDGVSDSYNEFMRTHSFSVAIAAVNSGVYAGVKHFADLGGGSASFALALRAAQPETRCSIFDLPSICRSASRYAEQFPGIELNYFPGSFFGESWPVNVDCFNLSNILHDWSPERGTALLKHAFDQLAPGGKVVISEILLNDDLLGPEAAVVFHLLMYMNHKAQQFSEAQLGDMLRGVGFRDVRNVTTFGDYTILSAVKPA